MDTFKPNLFPSFLIESTFLEFFLHFASVFSFTLRRVDVSSIVQIRIFFINTRTDVKDPIQDMASKEFVRLLTTYQSNIYAYIVSLVANFNDADDIIQETTSVMWEQFGQFKPGTDFIAWGNRIAYFKILDFRKRKRSDRKLIFSDEMLKKIADNAPAHLDNSGKSVQKLRDCIKKLDSPDESYVQLRYLTGLSVQEISRRFNTSIRSVYYSLARIQALLLICIEREDL